MGLVGLALLASGGCGDVRASSPREPATVTEIPILWQASGTYSRLSRRARIVVRDRATLAQVPLAEIPVDFETQMVLVCGLGPTPDDRSGVRIVRVWQDGTRIRVQQRTIYPMDGKPANLQPASPWTVVVIPKSELNVEGFLTLVPSGLLADHPGAY